MNRRNLLTGLFGVFGLASTAKAEDTTKLAQLTAERNSYKAALLRQKSREELVQPLEILESVALLPQGITLVNGKEERAYYTANVIMNGKLVGRCFEAAMINETLGWVNVRHDSAQKTNCGAFTIDPTSTFSQLVTTRMYGKIIIIGGHPKSFRGLNFDVIKAVAQHLKDSETPIIQNVGQISTFP